MSKLPSGSGALLLGVLFLTGCAQQPLSSIDRSKYRTVALDPEINAPAHYVYRDITGNRCRARDTHRTRWRGALEKRRMGSEQYNRPPGKAGSESGALAANGQRSRG